MHPLLTAGAARSLQEAARIARICKATTVAPTHLLWALYQEESQAAEILVRHGIGEAQLRTLLDMPAITPQPASLDAESELPQDAVVQNVLSEVRQQITPLGRQFEIGTEHLLWGLALLPSEVQAFLNQHGLHSELVEQHAQRQSGTASHPLEVDIQLSVPADRPSDHADVYRILDAAANRAREGIRVLEDFARFTLDDAHLMQILKSWRHDFSQAMRVLDSRNLLGSRETEQDVGTVIHTRHERSRESLLDVVRASSKRVQEALRSLEEYAKVISPELGERLGQLRYPLYTIERALLLTQASRERLAGCDLYLLVTEELCQHGSGPLIRSALAGGVSIVQVREKKMPDRKLLEHARRVREWTREAGAIFIMNDRPDLALLSDADGVHVGQDELSVRETRRIVGPERLVGVSTHTIEQARQAVLDGADYIGVGPVFPSSTKSFDQFAGLEFVKRVAAEITLPAFAIGGIGPKNVAEVVAAGLRRVAVSQAICGAEQPEFAARELRSALAAK